MKKIFWIALAVSCVSFFSYCSGSKKATLPKEPVPTFTYSGNIEKIITDKCGPCHIKGKGNKMPLDSFDMVKNNIDDIIRRIELNPGERGYMPFKKPKLTDSTINIIKTWKAEGFAK